MVSSRYKTTLVKSVDHSSITTVSWSDWHGNVHDNVSVFGLVE